MALEGTFKDFHIADIMQLIGLHQKTGVLTLEATEEALQIFVRDGEVVGVQSDRPPVEPRVAAALVARGILGAAKLEEALTQQREKPQPLGSLLAANGGVPKKEWTSALAVELEGRLYRPFRWKDAKYRFAAQDKVDPGEGGISPLRVDGLLMEGMRRADEWPLVLQDVPSPKLVFRVGGRQGGKVNPRDIQATDVSMLKLVDGKRTVEELVALSGLGEFEAMGGLANLVRANAISAVGPVPAAGAEGAAARALPARPVRRTPAPAQAAPPAWVARAAWVAAAACLLVVLAVGGGEPLGLFPVSPGQQRSLDQVRSLRAWEDMRELARRAEAVSVLTGNPPASVEALGALAAGRSLLQDPWGQPYRLVTEAGRTSIECSGADERRGTADDLVL